MPSTTPGPDAAETTPARRRRLVTTLVVIAVAVLLVDQLTKQWALASLEEGVRHPLVGDLLGLQLVFNPGAALGIATGMTWVLTLVATVVVVVVVRASRRIGSAMWAVALGLLLGGAVGNLVDRFAREPAFARGEVVDFIAYANWFVGNVADIAIVVAAGLIVLLAARGVHLDGTRDGDAAPDADPDPADDATGDRADTPAERPGA
ncbi:signal peptidase II [Cellulomonas fimi]|uniref:signal peptidase II n=1 Tax=Cellulomonas fimi TaxID=1708 RepID=UPI0023599761|nr:signal peptidase II [Cellulomonas fimi]